MHSALARGQEARAANTTDEADKAIKAKAFKVNGKTITEPKYPVGIGDIVETGAETYKLWINVQGKITFETARTRSPSTRWSASTRTRATS